MSSKDTSAAEEAATAASSRSESPPAPFQHQHSFEKRYVDLINRQILENTINKEVLQRQVQAFFPFSRNTSTERAKENQVCGADKVDNPEEKTNEHRKCLEKLETLDIKDKEEGTCD